MKLSPAMERFVLQWGEMGSRWGVSRSVAQVHALLYLSPEPLHADAITETLSIARSNVSMCLKELQGWGLIEPVHVLGDRRDYYKAEQDAWTLMTLIAEGRKQREIDPLVATLARCRDETAADPGVDATVAGRIAAMHDFIIAMSGWYDQVNRSPRHMLRKGMAMGARAARFVK